jgi:methylmalonyl-CoA mutase
MQKLFSEFNSTTAAQWKEQLVKDLKGIDYNTLVWKTNSGIEVQPFYTKENLNSAPAPLFTKNDWAICEAIDVKNEKAANTQALNSLQNGASGLVFLIAQKIDFKTLLKDISIEHIYILFKVTAEQEKELTAFLSTTNTGNHCFIECDELLNGKINAQTNRVAIDATLYQEAGSNTIHELAFTISHLNEYLTLSSNVKNIHLTVSIGGDFFMEIAKIRALRKLVQFLLNQYSIKAEVHIHAQTTLLNKSAIDSYTNMLRSTTEAMSASIGGADSILVLPFDITFNDSSDFSLRIARNQQLILKDESYLSAVADISAGSYYSETLTETLCKKSWEEFKTIESRGGMIACLKSKHIQDTISKDAETLIQQFKEGKLVLVGVNKFQNKNEQPALTKSKSSSNAFGIQAINLSESFVHQPANLL